MALDSRMRANLLLLAICQALGQACNTMMLSATALSVVTFYANRDLATLPVTMQHLGVMLWVFPAALLMQRMGRRFGFRVGSLFGMAGAATIGTGLYHGSFLVMCAGGFLLGYAVACLHQYRFAAVELVPLSHRAKAISWVTAGGIVAAFVGPSLVRWTHDQWIPVYIGTYAAIFLIHAVIFTVMSFIRFPESRIATSGVPDSGTAPPRPLAEIARQPRFVAAVVAAMVGYGVMVFLMGASPLAIVGCGMPHTEAHTVILMHVLGMFVPALFTGNLITRYGTTRIMAVGVVLLLAGVAAGLGGLTEWNFRIALTLNGVGWNFLFVGATTLVTTCYRPNERGKVQALNDFLIFGTTAMMSFTAGFLQERLGWFALNWFSLALLAMAALAVAWLGLRERRPVAAAA
ncbi:MFS transporter [Roseomonas sp. AR75]|uniref:MFS transporter n=1 Tax=Roseomonas sp. AR75 TaxID=2562311 RepID=UPI0014850B17|nr:MFS transporter [Roseomonas sp. AR75]